MERLRISRNKMFCGTNVRILLGIAMNVLVNIYGLVECLEDSTDMVNDDSTFTKCGGTLKKMRGYISTPSFPQPYPVPIKCQWVIEAPTDKVIALYFTQYYMREGLAISEYAFFSETLFLGRKEFDPINSDHEPTYLISNKPVLVLEFALREARNVHLRVREHLLDVHGFNVTYEFLSKNETIRKDPCIYNHCSFTGSCLASSFFEVFYCKCFADFFGPECQYSPGCEPSDSSAFCSNGGTCRYNIGSAVKSCECPPGFDGPHCERKKTSQIPEECMEMGCSQTCFTTATGDYRCSCFNGFHLAEDKRTCVEKGRIRYLVSFKVYDQNVDLAHLDTSRYNALKAGLESTLLQIFQPRLYNAENVTVLRFQPGAVVQFHFFGEKDQSAKAKEIFEENLKRGRIGRYAVDKNFLEFHWESALSILDIHASQKLPVVQGMKLQLTCIVQGSGSMHVQWLKDAVPVDVETPYRHISSTLVPKDKKDQYAASLEFDEVYVLDTGEFTCQISDWGTVQNKSIIVKVVAAVDPVVIPLTSTIMQGSSFEVTCLSEEDRYESLGYNWLKNGQILNPSKEPELMEDLFPGGSRLVIKEADESATYTCIITSAAGASKKDSVITVLSNDGSIPLCPAEDFAAVNWGQAAANTRDVQPCPKGFRGEVTRYCGMTGCSSAQWSQPDFSMCLSKKFYTVMESFRRLQLGYFITDVGKVLRGMQNAIVDLIATPMNGVGESAVDFIEKVHEYLKKRGGWNIDELKNNTEIFMDVVSLMMESPLLIQKQQQVIKLHQQILSYGLLHGTLLKGGTYQLFQRGSLVMEVGRLPHTLQKALHFPTQKLLPSVFYQKSILPKWLTDSVELRFDSWVYNRFLEMNDTLSIAVVFYRNFSIFLPQRFVARHSPHDVMVGTDLEYQLHSRLVAVAMQSSFRKGYQPPVKRSIQAKLKVKVRLAHLSNAVNQHITWNISCGMADFSEGHVQFSMDGCEPIQTGNFSLCECDRIGTYAVLLTTYAQSEDLSFHGSFDVIAGIGCGICAFFACLTFFIFIVLWRKIKGAITALKIQFCLALIATYGSILKALHESLRSEFYMIALPLVQFFLLASFCLQFCLCLTVYMEIVNLKGLQYQELKIATLGWAFPMIVVGATLVSQVPEKYKLTSWWLKFHSKHLYSFTASVLIILLLQAILATAVKEELKYIKKMDTKKHMRASMRSKLLNRSLVITLFLSLASTTSVLYVNYEEDHFKYAFAISSGVLGCVVFLCYTVCSENVNFLCSSGISIEEEKDEMKQELALHHQGSPFEGFVKPKIVGEGYSSGKMPKPTESEFDSEQIRIVTCHPTIISEPGSCTEQMLVEVQKQVPSRVVKDFTVHESQVPTTSRVSDVPKPDGSRDGKECPSQSVGNDKTPHTPSRQRCKENDESEDGSSPPFELQQLEESPKSSTVRLYEEEEADYELNHHGSAPDILETTSQQTTHAEETNAPGRAMLTKSAYATSDQHGRTACSTFRPPDQPSSSLCTLDVVSRTENAEKPESDSDDQKPSLQSTPPCPPIQSMIGDDKFEKSEDGQRDGKKTPQSTLKKTHVLKGMVHTPTGLNVPTPKVPNIEKEKFKPLAEVESSSQASKKGWSITAV